MDIFSCHFLEITSKLITNYQGDFRRLTSGGAKDHVGFLIRNQKKKDAAELRGSGASPAHTELDDLIEMMELHAAKNDEEGRRCEKSCGTQGHGGPQPN